MHKLIVASLVWTWTAFSLLTSNLAIAESSARDQCLLKELTQAADDASVKQIRARCEGLQAESKPSASGSESGPATEKEADTSLIEARLNREHAARENRSTLVPYRRNYFLPITYMVHPNAQPFEQIQGPESGDHLENVEAEFQFSLQVSLLRNLLKDKDALSFGFTTLSFWQAYNSHRSSPFRETDYEPELFYTIPSPWKLFNSETTLLTIGFSHQSNGRAAPLSRSWNRLFAKVEWDHDNFAFSLKPWWRIPEGQKADPLAATGDDNPDISLYMGNFEFTTMYRRNENELSAMIRDNFRRDNRAALQLDWTFPLSKRLRGYVQYFNGYGESLIDYNVHLQRIGVGIMLTDLL